MLVSVCRGNTKRTGVRERDFCGEVISEVTNTNVLGYEWIGRGVVLSTYVSLFYSSNDRTIRSIHIQHQS